jgi:hypothetical protein
MALTLGDYLEGSGALLECPACGGDYLNHVKIEIFEREEDANTGIHVSVTNDQITTDKDLVGNPSKRRHGLYICFKCEHCSATPVLTIAQHKGNTWVDFIK